MDVSGNQIWAVAGSQLASLDTGTKTVTPRDVGASPDDLEGIAVTADAVWIADFDASQLIRVPQAGNAAPTRIAVASPVGVLAIDKAIWVAEHHDGAVTRIDAATGKVIGTVKFGNVGSNGPQWMARSKDSVWVGESNPDQVVRLNLATGKVLAQIPVPFGACGGLLVTDTAIWASGCHEDTKLARIDPATNKVVTVIDLAGYTQGAVLANDALWIPEGYASQGQLERIDATTNAVTTKLLIPGMEDAGPSVVAGDTLWISDYANAVYAIPLSELTP